MVLDKGFTSLIGVHREGGTGERTGCLELFNSLVLQREEPHVDVHPQRQRATW